jgi:hypothetical protein
MPPFSTTTSSCSLYMQGQIIIDRHIVEVDGSLPLIVRRRYGWLMPARRACAQRRRQIIHAPTRI